MNAQKQLWGTRWWKYRSEGYYQQGIEETEEIYVADCEEVLGLLDLANKHIRAGKPYEGLKALAHDSLDDMLEIAEIEPNKYRELIPYLENPLSEEVLKAIEEENELDKALPSNNDFDRNMKQQVAVAASSRTVII